MEAPKKVERKFAKQVAPDAHPNKEIVIVKARVTKKGDGKISTGYHKPVDGDEFYATGEIIDLEYDNALVLEDRGFVEIQ